MQDKAPRISSPARLPGSRPSVTITDVAKLAGVSISAVSRTYTPGASVSPATRLKVEQAAITLDYRPNLVARSLIRRRSDTVAIAIASLENSFHAALLQSLTRALHGAGFVTMLFLADDDGNADPLIEDILRHRVDAIVLCAVSISPVPERDCRRLGVPLVLVNRETLDSETVAVVGDNAHGGASIAALLLATGHRRIAFIAGTPDSSTSRVRQDAFTTAMARAGAAAPRIVPGHFDRRGARDAARILLSDSAPPDALFCANDYMALEAMEVAAKEFGRIPGRDLSIVGYDDIPEARLGPGLTTYSQPVDRMASHAVDALCRLVAGEIPQVRMVLEGRLLLRGSCRSPAGGIEMVEGERVWIPPGA